MGVAEGVVEERLGFAPLRKSPDARTEIVTA
jgi:hypothetical protein